MFERRDIKYIYLKFSKKIRNFLLSEKSREFLIFLFFFLIASGFWLLQTLNNDYEAEFSIPVRLKEVPNDVVITSEPSSELRIKVKDRGTVLLNYMLGKSFFPVNLNFNDYSARNNHVRIYSSEFEKKIMSQLNVSTRLISVKPDTLEYIYSTGKSKRVPVKMQGKVTAARQYYLSDTIYSPDSVLVYAPVAILDTITTAYTRKVDLSNIADTLTHHVALAEVKGAKFIPNAVDLTFPVDMYTEKRLKCLCMELIFRQIRFCVLFLQRYRLLFRLGTITFIKLKQIPLL